MKQERIRVFTKGPIPGPLLAFSMPILLACFLYLAWQRKRERV